jgi:hypothetical protein
MKGSAVCRRFVHESKVCSLELGWQTDKCDMWDGAHM